MSTNTELVVTTFDADAMKASLIAYLQTKSGFEDINYEGSAISTIIDVLVRNSTYTSLQANMIANESFIESAQVRANVSSHAQKLSYLPRSCTAARAVVNLTVKPANLNQSNFSVSSDPGLTFFASYAGSTYTFTTKDSFSYALDPITNFFVCKNITIYQGQYLTSSIVYSGKPIVIQNGNIDTNTLSVTVQTTAGAVEYTLASSLTDIGADQNVYFLREDSSGLYEISFGGNIVGNEPATNAIINIAYVNSVGSSGIANGASIFQAAGSIGGYSNVQVDTVQAAYSGSDRDTIDEIRFLAPKIYQAQNRAAAPTDYEAIVKQTFPFIRNVKSWGGEDNNPPMYGQTMISIIPQDGFYLTTTMKNDIITALRAKGVASVTPTIVEPDIFTLNLTINYKVKPGVTSTSDVETFLKTTTQSYSDVNLLNFNSYYNEYELEGQFKSNTNIETVLIDKVLVATRTVSSNQNTSYDVDFGNDIAPGSFSITNFKIDSSTTNETIVDDSNGNIVYSAMTGGIIKKTTLGTIDYTSGSATFIASFISTDDLSISAIPTEDNIYTDVNRVVEIGDVNTLQITNTSTTD